MEVLAVPGDVMRSYVRVRRKLLGYTQKSFAQALDVPYPTYRDFESGETGEMKAGLFARIVDKLNIPVEHIRRLGVETLTLAEASSLAGQALTVQQIAALEARARADAGAMSDVELDRTLKMFDELKDDPRRYGEWLGYGRRLLDETADHLAPDEE